MPIDTESYARMKSSEVYFSEVYLKKVVKFTIALFLKQNKLKWNFLQINSWVIQATRRNLNNCDEKQQAGEAQLYV